MNRTQEDELIKIIKEIFSDSLAASEEKIEVTVLGESSRDSLEEFQEYQFKLPNEEARYLIDELKSLFTQSEKTSRDLIDESALSLQLQLLKSTATEIKDIETTTKLLKELFNILKKILNTTLQVKTLKHCKNGSRDCKYAMQIFREYFLNKKRRNIDSIKKIKARLKKINNKKTLLLLLSDMRKEYESG